VGSVLASQRDVDALIGIGIIVQGETHHAELIAESAAHAMMDIQVKTSVPFAFEILFVHSMEEARARLDRGREAADAVLHSLALLQHVRA
jgi:6,7-dimethyl-8-ribityllumazine synthase